MWHRVNTDWVSGRLAQTASGCRPILIQKHVDWRHLLSASRARLYQGPSFGFAVMITRGAEPREKLSVHSSDMDSPIMKAEKTQ